MATKDGFDPDDPLPLFLSADEPEPGIESDRAVVSLRFPSWRVFWLQRQQRSVFRFYRYEIR